MSDRPPSVGMVFAGKNVFYFVFGAAVACGGSVGDCACLDLRLRGRFATVFDLLCDFSGRRCGRVCLVLPSRVVRSAVALALFVPCVVGSTVMFFHSAVAFDCFAIVQGGSCCCAGQICGACLNLRLCLLGFAIVCIRKAIVRSRIGSLSRASRAMRGRIDDLPGVDTVRGRSCDCAAYVLLLWSWFCCRA